MKIIALFVAAQLLFTLTAFAQAPAGEPKLPDDAQRLKATYHQAAERAIQPLRERYIADLKRLLDTATRAGKLDQALAIKTELSAVSAAATATTDSVPEFEQRLFGTTWLWNNAFKFTFQPDRSTPGRGFKWQTVKPYAITYQYSDGNHGTIQFDSSLTRASIDETNPSGKQKKLTLTRIKE